MKKLRHVEIDEAEFDLEENKQGIFEGSSQLENLRILRNVIFPNDEVDRVNVLLRRCTKLQQLHIAFWGYHDFIEPFCLSLENLIQLQILRISFVWLHILSRLQLPSNLRKLVLLGIDIENKIFFIAGLSSLEYLQLENEPRISQSEEWHLGDITFHNLKFLKLVWSSISKWDASEESFPLLETLVLKECHNLAEIPLGFEDIPTLKQIKLIRCNNKSLGASAKRIKEEVEYNEGNDCIDRPHHYLRLVNQVCACNHNHAKSQTVYCAASQNTHASS